MNEIYTNKLFSNFFYYIYCDVMYGFDYRKQIIYEIEIRKNLYIYKEKRELNELPKKVINYFKKIK